MYSLQRSYFTSKECARSTGERMGRKRGIRERVGCKGEEREKSGDEREQKFMESMTTMLSVVSQFLAAL